MKRTIRTDPKATTTGPDSPPRTVSEREAKACGEVFMQESTIERIEYKKIPKGSVLAEAKLAGVMAAKRTGALVPSSHPLPITHCEIQFDIPDSRDRIVITASTKATGRAGLEIEALTAVSTAALTIYDMCKGIDKDMIIRDVRVVPASEK